MDHLCPLISTFRLYGFPVASGIGVRPDRDQDRVAGVVRSLLVLGSFAFVAYYSCYYEYWRVDQTVGTTCHAVVVAVVLLTTLMSFFTTWLFATRITAFLVGVYGLQAGRSDAFSANARLYGRRLSLMTYALTLLKVAEGLYQTGKTALFDNNNETIGSGTAMNVVILNIMQVLFFSGICEHFAFTFMAFLAYCCYIIRLAAATSTMPANNHVELLANRLKPKEAVLRPTFTRQMISLQKHHVKLTELVYCLNTIYSHMIFFWMTLLTAGICFCVRELRLNLVESRNLSVVFLILLHFALYLVLLSVISETNETLRRSVATFSEIVDCRLKDEMPFTKTRIVVDYIVMYINNLSCRPVGITVWRFFIVEQELVPSLLGTLVSYSLLCIV